MKRFSVLVLCLAALTGVGLVALLRPSAAERALESYPRIVLVTLDTLHVEQTGVFNEGVDFTPQLDRLAAEGIVFEQARTTAPMTLPAHTSMLSGRTPLGLGLLRNGMEVPPDVETLPQRLNAAGYSTAAFLSLATLRQRFGLDRGFEHYDDGHGDVPRFYRTADEVYDAASAWIEGRSEPYFLWVHLSDPHEPYVQVGAEPDAVLDFDGEEIGRFNLATKETHEITLALPPGEHQLRWTSLREPRPDERAKTVHYLGFRDNTSLIDYVADWRSLPNPDAGLGSPFVLELRNDDVEVAEVEIRFHGGVRVPPESEVLENYVAEVEYADEYLGRLRSLVESDGRPTLWIVASDHGEGIYRRDGIIGHAGFGFEHQLRILWLMQGPGIPKGRRLGSQVALTQDIAPTILDVLGLAPLEEVEGMSFVPCWEEDDCGGNRSWFAHGFSRGRDSLSSVATYSWPLKLLQQDAFGVAGFDLREDAWETEALDLEGTVGASLELRRLQREMGEVREILEKGLSASAGEVSAEDLEMLRSLGYLN